MVENIDKIIELSIILPLLGKEISLEGLLKLLPIDIKVPYEFIFICHQAELDPLVIERINNSYDKVRWIEKSNESTLRSLQQAVEAAVGKYILIVRTDTAGPIIAINQMLNLAKEGCDFINGTRYAAGGMSLGGSTFEMGLSRLANGILHFAGCAFTDATIGLKMFRKDIFKQLQLQSRSTGWVVVFEMALKAQTTDLKLGEVATVAVDRLYGGYSTGDYKRHFLEYIKWFFWGCAKLPQRSTKKSKLISQPIQISD